MSTISLIQAVEHFALQTQDIPDANLDRAWAWRAYESEGIRFAFFRTYEELRELAVILRSQRASLKESAPLYQSGPLNQTELVLAPYEAAFWDFQAAIMGVEDDLEKQVPAEGGWPVRKAVEHIFGAELGFYVAIRYALDHQRAGDPNPGRLTEEIYKSTVGLDEDGYAKLMSSSWTELRAAYAEFHARVLGEFAAIAPDELGILSFYWENEPMSLRFRLHRFDSHLRQHTIHIDKILVGIGRPPNEARRLLRLIYSALADVNAALFNAPQVGEKHRQELAEAIYARSAEIAQIGLD